jgi:hypothetical protein
MTQVNEFKKEIKADTKEWKADAKQLEQEMKVLQSDKGLQSVEAAVKMSRLLSRCQSCC